MSRRFFSCEYRRLRTLSQDDLFALFCFKEGIEDWELQSDCINEDEMPGSLSINSAIASMSDFWFRCGAQSQFCPNSSDGYNSRGMSSYIEMGHAYRKRVLKSRAKKCIDKL